jgi:hypothetical protein
MATPVLAGALDWLVAAPKASGLAALKAASISAGKASSTG